MVAMNRPAPVDGFLRRHPHSHAVRRRQNRRVVGIAVLVEIMFVAGAAFGADLAVGDVRHTDRSPAHLRVEWDDRAGGEQGFRLWRRRLAPEGPRPWHLAGEVPANVTHFDDGGLQHLTDYEHKVAAFDAGGEGPAMTVASPARTPRMANHLEAHVVVPPGEPVPHSPSALAGADGRLLLAYVRSPVRGWIDASIWLRRSADGGRTWGEPQRAFTGDTRFGFAKPAVVALPDGTLGMSFSRFTLDAQGRLPAAGNRERFFVKSQDGGLTWSSPVKMWDGSSNNDSLIVADGNRLLQPLQTGHGPNSDPLAQIVASDDFGATWRTLSRAGAPREAWETGESALAYAGTRRLVLLCRHEAAFHSLNFSADNGVSWEGPKTLWLGGGDNPPKIAPIPGTPLLVAIVHSWQDGAKAKDRRQLASVISADGGRTWDNFRLIGFAPEGDDGFLQHSLTFGGDIAYIFYGSGSRHDTQDGKDLRLIRLHRDFFTSRTAWPYGWQGRPAVAVSSGR